MTAITIAELARELGADTRRLRRLTDLGIIPATKTAGGHRRYDLESARTAYVRHRLGPGVVPGAVTFSSREALLIRELRSTAPIFDHTYVLAAAGQEPQVDETAVWSDLREHLSLERGSPADGLASYAFTEILNNAIDHSNGAQARVRAWRTDVQLLMEISDDGEGVYEHLAAGRGLADNFEALEELQKGRRTTMPERHSGEGIFFTSKAVRHFELSANGLTWIQDNVRQDMALEPSTVDVGTLVLLELDPRGTRVLADVFKDFSDDDFAFTASSITVTLFDRGVEFVSRSQGKRIMAGMEDFTRVTLDFRDVGAVGQGFADEVFRVWSAAHSDVTIVPINMSDTAEYMVRRGIAARDRDNG